MLVTKLGTETKPPQFESTPIALGLVDKKHVDGQNVGDYEPEVSRLLDDDQSEVSVLAQTVIKPLKSMVSMELEESEEPGS